MVWQKQKATFFLPASRWPWDGWPCAGLPGAPKHPLVGRPAKANHGFLELETQLGPNLVWHGAEETAFSLSLGKKKEPRG